MVSIVSLAGSFFTKLNVYKYEILLLRPLLLQAQILNFYHVYHSDRRAFLLLSNTVTNFCLFIQYNSLRKDGLTVRKVRYI